MTSSPQTQPVGSLLRDWRQRRRMSQLDLACEAEISTRHLSFVETGRAQPSREMLLHLADQLEVPLRERNALLVAAGYAPVYPERPLTDPSMEAARRAVELVLAGHEPYPAIAIDRHWTLVAANRTVGPILVGADPSLLEPPVNVLRLSLHPKGLASRTVNYTQWREHILDRVRRQVDVTADHVLADLLEELEAYPIPDGAEHYEPLTDRDYAGVVIPLEYMTDFGVLSFVSTTTVFGTPVDVTLSELAVESFFPANAQTAEALRRIAEG